MSFTVVFSRDLAVGNPSGAPITLHSPLLTENLRPERTQLPVFITEIRSRWQMISLSSYAPGDKAQEKGSGKHGFPPVTGLGTPHTNAKNVCRNWKPQRSRSPS